jgi:hypothetical protein
MVSDDLREFMNRYLAIENQLELLKEDKKNLFDDFKEKVKPSVIREAIRQARLRSKLGDDVAELDNLVEQLDGKLH